MQKMKNNKKGIAAFNLLTGGAIAILVLVVVLIITFSVNEQLRTTVTTNSLGYNASVDADTAISNIPTFLPVIVIVLIAVVILLFVRQLQVTQ